MRTVGILLLLLVYSWPVTSIAEPRIAVIVNIDSSFADISRKQIVDIYMGRLLSLPDNHIPLPLDQQAGSPLRKRFYESLVERPLAFINSYWARLMFSGRATPPRMLPDSLSVLLAVSKNQDAIGYIEENEVDASVKILFYVD